MDGWWTAEAATSRFGFLVRVALVVVLLLLLLLLLLPALGARLWSAVSEPASMMLSMTRVAAHPGMRLVGN